MPHLPDDLSAPEGCESLAGLPIALVWVVLLIGSFALITSETAMPPAERWAALTTFALLTLAYVLQGYTRLYDALGYTVQQNTRALMTLVALVPTLYVSYSYSVDAFTWSGLITAVFFVAVPTVAFLQNQRVRYPTLLDGVAVLYLWLSVTLHLVPDVQLPQRGGQIGFFMYSTIPLLLLLLAARGWSGLGFTWFLRWSDLLITLQITSFLLFLLTPIVLAMYPTRPAVMPPTMELLARAVMIYFFVALPQEILFRGVVQKGIERAAERALHCSARAGNRRWPGSWRLHPRWLSLLLAAVLSATVPHLAPMLPDSGFLLTFLTSLGYGYVYQHTGKVTASAVVHMLVLWCWSVFIYDL